MSDNIKRTFRVGKRWVVNVSSPVPIAGSVVRIEMEWSPSVPTRPLSRREMREYIAGRDKALEQMADEIAQAAEHADLMFTVPPHPGGFVGPVH